MKDRERRANVHDFLSEEDQRRMLLWDKWEKGNDEIELKYNLPFLLLEFPFFVILTALVRSLLPNDWSWLIIIAAIAVYTLVWRIVVYFKIRELTRKLKLDLGIRD